MVVPCCNGSSFSLLENQVSVHVTLCHLWESLISKQGVAQNLLIYSSLIH